MIDDSKRMCTDIKKYGIRAFIMDTPYNIEILMNLNVYVHGKKYMILYLIIK